LFNVVDEMTASMHVQPGTVVGPGNSIPIGVNIQLITLWSRDDIGVPDHGRGRSRLLRPGEAQAVVAGQPYNVDLSVAKRHRQIGNILNVPYTQDGLYHFLIEREVGSEWEEVARVPLEVTATFESADL
jgi:hypothetical protein